MHTHICTYTQGTSLGLAEALNSLKSLDQKLHSEYAQKVNQALKTLAYSAEAENILASVQDMLLSFSKQQEEEFIQNATDIANGKYNILEKFEELYCGPYFACLNSIKDLAKEVPRKATEIEKTIAAHVSQTIIEIRNLVCISYQKQRSTSTCLNQKK
jgi:hypothetical protein